MLGWLSGGACLLCNLGCIRTCRGWTARAFEFDMVRSHICGLDVQLLRVAVFLEPECQAGELVGNPRAPCLTRTRAVSARRWFVHRRGGR